MVLIVATCKDASLGVVDCAIRLVPFDVFIAIFGGGDGEDDYEGEDDETWGDSRKCVEELKDGDGEEETAGREERVSKGSGGDGVQYARCRRSVIEQPARKKQSSERKSSRKPSRGRWEDAYMLATLRNCSKRFRGRKVMMVYFEVIT